MERDTGDEQARERVQPPGPEEGVADQEQAFLIALQDVTSYTVDDEGRLVLEDGATLTFEVAGEAE